ncbi:alpha/beta fold hydrolase [Actinomadura barringtoniae]|uniref:Alpha/beta fold hydrolase n=1 Tax=Actinomadura barringtoniae TaxID=1427535 RepID=A0A939PGV1_9ACTN|nr:alpha/beta fold hydrolase [Actinomadura barringtoniae]MBO2449504.1 alpha/beta fold hydrolase [Actinomadura barringtoniae]
MTYRHSGLVFTEHTLPVPVDHRDPGGARIEVFAREVSAADRPGDPGDLPFLLYLEGGPGRRAPRHLPPWLWRAVQRYRVVLMDQRGTGRSAPATRQTLARRRDPAAYLLNFRADSIVRDAEMLREHLAGDRPWSVLGQSYGGFCSVAYLSYAPESLREVMIAGGLPPLYGSTEDVYRAAYPRVLAANERYFERYPDDQKVADRVVEILDSEKVLLPSGDRLSPRRFQMLGLGLGSRTGFDGLHNLLEEAFVDVGGDQRLSEVFLRRVDNTLTFAEYPLYALMHESVYCQGTSSSWAAHRARAGFPQFDLGGGGGGPTRFTGEMIYPWLFDEDPALAPLVVCAEQIAAYAHWPRLYDLDRLAANTVPVSAAIYYDDMYVDRETSLATAAAIRGLRPWITNEFGHDGLGQDAAVFDRLVTLVRE